MQTFLKWAAVATVMLAACGGNVVVDGATGTTTSTGGYTTSSTSTGYGGYYDTSVVGSGAYPTTNDASSSGFPYPDAGNCGLTCAQWLDYGGTGICAGGAESAVQAVLTCACGSSPCATACGYNACQYTAISSPCEQCLQMACAVELSSCEEN
jgi:hypothetical protein